MSAPGAHHSSKYGVCYNMRNVVVMETKHIFGVNKDINILGVTGFETKIFQKTIISPVFLPASGYFVAILNIALRHWIYIIHKWALFIEMYCILLIIVFSAVSSIVFSAVDPAF